MQVSMIVAASENNVIGVDNELPWRLPDDLKFFKKQSLGKPVIMGKNTWISLGKALPGRLNIVISATLKEVPEGVLVFSRIEEALDYLRAQHHAEVAIIGGGQIYKAAMHLADVIYMTRVHTTINNGTAFFPVIAPGQWQLVWEEAHPADDKHAFAFTFQRWEAQKTNA
ncbi:dihydrofolate reductase [Taibaiella chishuiensis]|uniref:Dihydrofolate reductase n=1 Tax=Taibaiella chishuiensis TaxID=1434707 RepID=A0A2P8CVS6_9BACT|nr:dihydrofolate reductase [Taibaiella chishuiensis]PSK89046.1 dihydrofolate reductase [Taibaiella chishuiensis]